MFVHTTCSSHCEAAIWCPSPALERKGDTPREWMLASIWSVPGWIRAMAVVYTAVLAVRTGIAFCMSAAKVTLGGEMLCMMVEALLAVQQWERRPRWMANAAMAAAALLVLLHSSAEAMPWKAPPIGPIALETVKLELDLRRHNSSEYWTMRWPWLSRLTLATLTVQKGATYRMMAAAGWLMLTAPLQEPRLDAVTPVLASSVRPGAAGRDSEDAWCWTATVQRWTLQVLGYAPWLPILVCSMRLTRSSWMRLTAPPRWRWVGGRCGRSMRAFPRHKETTAFLRGRGITIAEIKAFQEKGGTLRQLAAAEQVSEWAVQVFIKEEMDRELSK